MNQALIVIDMQEVFFSGEKTYLYRQEELLDNINKLIDTAKSKKLPVIFIQHTDTSSAGIMAKGKHAWKLHRLLHQSSEDIVIEKNTWDSFYNTSLETTLKNLDIQQLIFAGAQTEFCLDTTIRIAYSKGYQNNLLIKGTHSTLPSAELDAEKIIKHHESVWSNRFLQLREN